MDTILYYRVLISNANPCFLRSVDQQQIIKISRFALFVIVWIPYCSNEYCIDYIWSNNNLLFYSVNWLKNLFLLYGNSTYGYWIKYRIYGMSLYWRVLHFFLLWCLPMVSIHESQIKCWGTTSDIFGNPKVQTNLSPQKGELLWTNTSGNVFALPCR